MMLTACAPMLTLRRIFRRVKKIDLHEAGEDYENVKGGFIDYLLLDGNQKPVAIDFSKPFLWFDDNLFYR